MGKDAPNNKELAPLGHYLAKYAATPPESIAVRCQVPFDAGASSFALEILAQPLRATWPGFELSPLDGEACPPALYGAAARILLLRHLLEGVSAPSGGRFLAYRELPWGEVYDGNFQGRCVRRLARTFGVRLGDFARAAQRLGGAPTAPGGGAGREDGREAWELAFLPDVKVRLLLRAGDEEFPASAQFLFSDNAALAFSAEDLAVVGDLVVAALAAADSRGHRPATG
ncbi:MAG: DUF3786 domain-containing protein [Acidobacteriota bacterium]|nr:DUF3786 domain-containing protein [Acidobacteriota bacterium]